MKRFQGHFALKTTALFFSQLTRLFTLLRYFFYLNKKKDSFEKTKTNY